MYFVGGDRHLYLTSWQYNVCRIINELAKIVENNGGRVKPADGGTIQNRSLMEKMKEARQRLEAVEKYAAEHPENGTTKQVLYEYQVELERLEAIPNEPIDATGSYITFELDGYFYYFQLDDNPFFDHFYRKAKVLEDGTYSGDACCENMPGGWKHNCLFEYDCAKADIVETAYEVFNILTSADASEIRRSCHKVKVKNTYNDGTHYEVVPEPERFCKIDF